MRTWEHIKLGSSQARVLLGEIPQNTHRNKKGVVYIGAGSPKALHRHQTKIVEILWRSERMCLFHFFISMVGPVTPLSAGLTIQQPRV